MNPNENNLADNDYVDERGAAVHTKRESPTSGEPASGPEVGHGFVRNDVDDEHGDESASDVDKFRTLVDDVEPSSRAAFDADLAELTASATPEYYAARAAELLNVDGIPPALRALPQWTLWAFTDNGSDENGKPKKPGKVPLTCKGTLAQSNNPATWATFDAVVAALRAGVKPAASAKARADGKPIFDDVGGVAFVFTKESGIVGVDLDKCRHPVTGEIAPWACDDVADLSSWTEVSPTGTGLHVFVRGKIPGDKGIASKKREMYAQGRFFAMTGRHVEGTPLHVVDVDDGTLAALAARIEGDKREEKAKAKNKPPPKSGSPIVDLNARDVGGTGRADFDEAVAEVASAAPSTRNNTLNECAYRIGRMVAAGIVTEGEAFSRLAAAVAPWGSLSKDAACIERAFVAARTARNGPWAPTRRQSDAADVDAVDWQAVIREARRSHTAGPANGDAGADKTDRTGGADPTPPVSSVLSAWGPPMPIRSEPLQPFPVDRLPPPLAGYVAALAETLQVPPDLPALGVLAACAAAVQRRIEVAPTSDWRETLSLYALGVAESADRKSAAMAEVQRPLRAIEGRLATEARPAIVKRAADRRVLEKRLKEVETLAAKAREATERKKHEEEAEALAFQLAGLPVLHAPRLLADDVTPEAVAVILAEQRERLAIFSAEGGVFGTIAGRYSQNGDANVDVFLKGHCGDGLRVDRKTKDPQTGERSCIALERPALTMALFVQPEVVDEVTKDRKLRGRGLVARFLYAYPQSLVGSRSVDAPPMPSATRDAYAATIERLFARAMVGTAAPAANSATDLGFDTAEFDGDPRQVDVVTLSLDDEAAGVLRAFRQRIEPRLAPATGDLACLGSWGGKLVGAIVRIAALFHLVMDDSNNDVVCGDAMERAVAFADYFVDHAKGAMRLMGIDPTSRKALLILRAAKTQGWQTVSRRDVHRALESTFRNAADLEAPLSLLEERGWIRWLPQPEGKSGRPSQCLVFHPSTHDGT
jgi:replicative DNA helicase